MALTLPPLPAEHRVVSVVIPTYGRPRQIRECLTALASQTISRDAFEVVVVDDGSPEPLDTLADEFAGRLHMRLIRQNNAGPSAARNTGVAHSTGDLIALTDDDCLPAPDWLTTLVGAERERPGALVGGSTENGLPELVFSEASQWVVDLVYDHFNHDHDHAYFFTSNNMLCSRRHYQEIGGFDAMSYSRAGAEDRDFCDRWRTAGWPLIFRPEAKIEHRHPQSLGKFLDLHYRYGRGAFLYQANRRRRASGTMKADLGFHAALPRRIWSGMRRHPGVWRRAQLCGALVLWQVANAAGFFTESLVPRPDKRRNP